MEKGKTGPKPETLKLTGDWKESISRALTKKRPEGGWPKPPAVPQRARKRAKPK